MEATFSNGESIYTQLIIEEIREVTRNFKTFFFREGHRLNFHAGQFLTLAEQNTKQEIRRSYSILSSPALNERLSIAVKRIDNGYFSRKLVDHARVGDRLLTTGAAGFFLLPENIESFKTLFFFAAGSGMVPIMSLLKTVLHLYPQINVVLVYSNHSLQTTAWYAELKQMEIRFPKQLHIDFLFSSYPDIGKARLNREYVLDILSHHHPEKMHTLFYTCGPENYMRMIIFLLREEGFPIENIKKEDFNSEKIKRKLDLPPDTNTYLVQLEMKGKTVEFPVQYPDSILQSARRQKLILPYSCETGICGSCAVQCVSGEVWLSHNEVLTEGDLRRGLTLTCTGHPQKGNVYLKIDG